MLKKNELFYYICIFLAFFLFFEVRPSQAIDLKGRLGIGMTQQLINDIPAISIKNQNNDKWAIGILFALDTSSTRGGYGFGGKFYNIIFSEPLLNYYSSFMLAILNKKTPTESQSGFQLDATLGAEFQFNGVESLGFSFEFGASLYKLGDGSISLGTTGYHFIKAAIHFYL